MYGVKSLRGLLYRLLNYDFMDPIAFPINETGARLWTLVIFGCLMQNAINDSPDYNVAWVCEPEIVTKFYSTKKSPARLNISYNFSLENSIHPTDIATGFKGNVYPSKTSHWGSIVNTANWKTIFFLRNCSHNPEKTEHGNAVFKFFDNSNSFTKKISVPPETCITFELNQNTDFKKFISWKCKGSVGTIEIFWVSYNQKNGAVCGDHSF